MISFENTDTLDVLDAAMQQTRGRFEQAVIGLGNRAKKDEARLRNLGAAGITWAEIYVGDGKLHVTPIVFKVTPVTETLGAIHGAEKDGDLPEGSFADALDKIELKEFEESYFFKEDGQKG